MLDRGVKVKGCDAIVESFTVVHIHAWGTKHVWVPKHGVPSMHVTIDGDEQVCSALRGGPPIKQNQKSWAGAGVKIGHDYTVIFTRRMADSSSKRLA